MAVFENIHHDNYEQIIYCHDSKVGLKAIIAMHNTALGPATGGCRMWDYATEAEALNDVLRLSKGMTYKASISKLALGGGKSVIMGPPSIKTPELLKRFGEYVNRLGGNYITAKDVGIDSNDLKQIKSNTPHILGIAGEENSSGDPSPVTAWGVFNGIKASAEKAFGTKSLSGLKIALQGLGAVNFALAKHLHLEGAKLIGCDINKDSCAIAKDEFDMEIVNPEDIFTVDCDIFSPGALGAIINNDTIPNLKCKVVAGAANNQLANPEVDGPALHKRGILYAPDYTINAGGLINIYHERDGYNKDKAWKHVEGIYDTIKDILDRSAAEKTPEHIIADKIALDRVREAELARK